MNWKTLVSICAAGLLLGVQDANANLITSLPGGTVLSFPAVNLTGAGPQTVAPGVTWTSTNSNSVYGWTNGYGFANNGNWSGNPPLVGLDNGAGISMTFSFATPVSEVGGILNWALCNGGCGFGNAVISVFDSGNNLIESFALTSTNGTSNVVANDSFYGFNEATPEISRFTLSGDVIAIRDLTEATPVPGPIVGAGLPGAIVAFGGLLGWMRRRKAAVAA